MFEPVNPRVSFPEMEARILEFWRDARIFEKSLDLRRGSEEWVFYEGPPTANGKPGIHHVEARTFKDVYPRFKTMTGHFVPRKAGWDCHGLPVELEVEKEIGTSGKKDIEAFGIGEFTRLCRESVTRYVADWERMTERIGFWIDMSDAYWTMNTEYVESVWWSLKELHSRGLLFEADKVTAYCPRCGTPLSDAEVALGYETVADPSLYLKFTITKADDATLVGAKIAVWTTTPWTLLSNLGLAVSAQAPYVMIDSGGERLIVAKALAERLGLDPSEPGRSVNGQTLVGARYEPVYENADGGTHRVVAGDFVSMDEGTGVVHIAPAFGADDLAVGLEQGWPVYKPVDDTGRFTDEAALASVRGMFVKDADPLIVEDLKSRGLVLKDEPYEHSYPHCWRCSTPLIYYARTSWYVGTTLRKQRLLEVNETVNWYPDHIRLGRYGNWLENNIDWALSRNRYWGTPLPVWRCERKHTTVVASLTELGVLAGRDVTGIDPHRPAIDYVTINCPDCGEEAQRETEVIDTWYDSGAMPFAQFGYHPGLGRGLDEFRGRFPADFISEAIDQTRGWFYTLMAEAVLLFDDTAYKNVVCLGHLVAEDGRKMSKSLGNVIDPWDVLDRHGADALRWFLLTSGSPWASRRVGLQVIEEVVKRFMLTLWNTYSFFVTYANADGFDPGSADVSPAERPLLDRWVLSQMSQTIGAARESLDAYDATGAGRRIAQFVDDLSNWYVRRARRRFWDPAGEKNARDKAAAYLTLYESLLTVSRLLAPFTPFIAEEMWRNLARGREESVHLSDYPSADASQSNPALDAAMFAARQIVSLGRMVRNDARIRVRQPLSSAVVHYPGDHGPLSPLLSLVAEELNVKRVEFAESAEHLAGWRAKPNYKALGPRIGPKVRDVAAAMAADDGSLASALAAGEDIEVAGVAVGPGEADLVQTTKEGWGVAADSGLTVALDLEPSRDLVLEGLAREIVRMVQDSRKAGGFDVSDRIELGVRTDGDLAEALSAHRRYVAGETLAVSIEEGDVPDPAHVLTAEIDGRELTISLRAAGA